MPTVQFPNYTTFVKSKCLLLIFRSNSTMPNFKVFTQADPSFLLTIRDGELILAKSNRNDPAQEWIRDDKYNELWDEQGFPAFALANRSTGQALKHPIVTTPKSPVYLTKYDPDKLEGSVLWTLGPELSGGYRVLRPSNNVRMHLDARWEWETKKILDGTTMILGEWNEGTNQRWKIARVP